MPNSSIPSATELPTIDPSELTYTTGGEWSQGRRNTEAAKWDKKSKAAKARGDTTLAESFRLRAVQTKYGVNSKAAQAIIKERRER
jgi:hypothetical protein